MLVTDNPDRGMIPPYPKIIIGLARQGPLVPIPGFEPGNRKCEDNGIPKHFCTFWSNCFNACYYFTILVIVLTRISMYLKWISSTLVQWQAMEGDTREFSIDYPMNDVPGFEYTPGFKENIKSEAIKIIKETVAEIKDAVPTPEKINKVTIEKVTEMITEFRESIIARFRLYYISRKVIRKILERCLFQIPDNMKAVQPNQKHATVLFKFNITDASGKADNGRNLISGKLQ